MVARGWRMWNIRSMNFSHKCVHKSMYVLCHLHKYINLCVKTFETWLQYPIKILILLSSFSIEERTLTDSLRLRRCCFFLFVYFFFSLVWYNFGAVRCVFDWNEINGVNERAWQIFSWFASVNVRGKMCARAHRMAQVKIEMRDKFVFQLKSLMHWLNGSHCKWIRT